MSLSWVNSAAVLSAWACQSLDVGWGPGGAARTLEEGVDGDDAGGADVDGQLVLPHRELLNVLGQRGHEPRAVLVQVVGLGLVLVGGVDERDLEDANGITGLAAGVRGVLGQGDGAGGRRREASQARGGVAPRGN